jgi:lysophospholipase L1-like esterase
MPKTSDDIPGEPPDAPGSEPEALEERQVAAGPDAPDEPEGTPDGSERRRVSWTYALAVSVAAFLVWLVFDAPTLQHNAQAQPVGARRTVSLDTLGPLALLSRGLQLSHVVSVADGAMGRNGNTPGNGSGPVTIGPVGHHPHVNHPSTTVAPGPTASTTTTTTVPGDQRPTAADPLRVLIIGDSLGLDLGNSLQNSLANTGVVSATLDGKESTGLTRPDYYNWPAELQSDMSRIDPQVVVVMIGANDPQDFPGPPDVPYGSAQWNQIYGQRVSQFMHIATQNGGKLIWVGMPPMQDPGRNAAMQNLNGIVADQAAKAPNVAFLSSSHLLGGPQAAYTPYLEVNGQEVNVREPDGTHIAPGGGDLLAQAVMNQMHSGLGISFGG